MERTGKQILEGQQLQMSIVENNLEIHKAAIAKLEARRDYLFWRMSKLSQELNGCQCAAIGVGCGCEGDE